MTNTHNTNNNIDKSTHRFEVHAETLDDRCKNIVLLLQDKINLCLDSAIKKSTNLLVLLDKSSNQTTTYADCLLLLKQQKISLRKGIIFNPVKAPFSTQQKQAPGFKQPADLETISSAIERFETAYLRNMKRCLDQYQAILKRTPLLNNFQLFPTTCGKLLYLNPEHLVKTVESIIKTAPVSVHLNETVHTLNRLILLSFFNNKLATIYRDIHFELVEFFCKHQQEMPGGNISSMPVDYPAASLVSLQNKKPISAKTRSAGHQIINPQTLNLSQENVRKEVHINIENAQQDNQHNPLIPTINNLVAEEGTAIERQLCQRVLQERTALTQIKQLPLGTLLKWDGSHYDRTTQILKVVLHDRDNKKIAFHDEETGLFVRYGYQELINPLLTGDLNHYVPELKKTKKLKNLFNYLGNAYLS